MPASDVYACLTGDLVASRLSEDREAVQLRLEEALSEANASFGADLAVRLSVTLGDEWQGLFHTPDVALEADLLLRTRLYPVEVRAGVGAGRVSTPLRETTARMDGECFHRSRQALEAAGRRRIPGAVLLTGEPLLDAGANAVCGLLAALAAGWTEKQLRSTLAYRELGTEQAAAAALGVSQPTLHQSLDGARGKEFVEGFERLLEFVRLCASGASKGEEAP
ncbi:MAG: hypothetical protein HZB55_08850 [Deltaproteobacteria bacterium]|nr:hypothetical protein [Deltaproteobacteria bacterium]